MTAPSDGAGPHRAGGLRIALRLPVYLYRWHVGWLLRQRFLLPTHIGRRTGQRHETVLEVVGRDAAGDVTVMSGWGRRADWYRNIDRQPLVEITVGRRTTMATHQELPASEAMEVLAGYEHRNRVAGWLIRRTISSLVGWRYDGTVECRQRLIRQLPLIAFRPRLHGRDNERRQGRSVERWT